MMPGKAYISYTYLIGIGMYFLKKKIIFSPPSYMYYGEVILAFQINYKNLRFYILCGLTPLLIVNIWKKSLMLKMNKIIKKKIKKMFHLIYSMAILTPTTLCFYKKIYL